MADIDAQIKKHLKMDKSDDYLIHLESNSMDPDENPGVIFIQVSCRISSLEPISFDVTWTPDSLAGKGKAIINEVFDNRINLQASQFNRQFEQKFPATRKFSNPVTGKHKQQTESENQNKLQFYQTTLSNMLSGFGYWHGHYRVKSSVNVDNQVTEKINICQCWGRALKIQH